MHLWLKRQLEQLPMKMEILIWVSVLEKNTYNGITTDFDGKFSLPLTTENPVIILKFVGYRDFEVAYSGTSIVHQMEVDAIGLDAVVVSASKEKNV
jgi:hypothetical protein